jgi:hypothetical protein
MNEDAPTMSVGTGGFSGSSAATGPVAGFDPLLGQKKVKRRKYGTKKKEVKEDAADRYGKSNYLPFLVCYDGAEQYVLYGKSPAEIKIQLRKIYRPENHKKIRVKRLYPNEVIKFYWNKRQAALTDQ